MPHSSRWNSFAERGLLGLLLAWLLWLPLPFGSNVELARVPLIAVPLALCAITAIVRLAATRQRTSDAEVMRVWKIWSGGAVVFVAVVALQLVPLPPALVRAISPESDTIWTLASRAASLGGAPVAAAHPITVDPAATRFELFRLIALFAAFQCATLLFRTGGRRLLLAGALTLSAIFQTLYGVREAALGRYAIWGWINELIFSRVTGTYVNPNHFAHYAAILLPMAFFLAAFAWRESTPSRAPLRVRIVKLFEGRIVLFGFAMFGMLACVAAILLAQSRGALLALAAGLSVVAAMRPGARLPRLAFGAAAGAIVVAALVFLLGQERTVSRFGDVGTSFSGRRVAVVAGAGVWSRFSLLGSGAGTFDRVARMEQREGLDRTYHHAHNDYVEIGATTGTLGFVIVFVTLAAGYVALVRQTFGASELSWKRRAFQAAALASLTIALVHALIDFNFYIPANPATLAAIAGAAVTVTDHDRRSRR